MKIYACGTNIVFECHTNLQSNVENFMMLIGETKFYLSHEPPKGRAITTVTMDKPNGNSKKFTVSY